MRREDGVRFYTGNGCLSSASDNFDKELMMDHNLDELPQFLIQVITSSLPVAANQMRRERWWLMVPWLNLLS